MKNQLLRCIFALVIALLLLSPFGEAQGQTSGRCDFEWARSAGYTLPEGALDIASDSLGGLFITGYFTDTLEIGGQTLAGFGGTDVFLAKYDTTGAFLWARVYGGPEADTGMAVQATRRGEVYLTGRFSTRAEFDSYVLLSRGGTDIFLAKVDAQGKVDWAKRAGGPLDDAGNDLDIDPNGNLLIAGMFQDTANFTGTRLELEGLGGQDVFIAKYDSRGDVVWVREAGSPDGNDAALGVVSGADSSVYITGRFQNTANFGPGISQASAGGGDIFTARYAPDGTVSWAERGGGPNNDAGQAIDVFGNGVFIAGYHEGGATIGDSALAHRGQRDMFVARFRRDGVISWTYSADGPLFEEAYDLAMDTSGHAIVTGFYQQWIQIGDDFLADRSNLDVFVAEIDENGQPVWANSAGGIGPERAFGVALDLNQSLFIAGRFESPAAAFGVDTLATAGGSDLFVAKVCNFTRRPCELAIGVETQAETALDNDGQIVVDFVSGGRGGYRYSLDDSTYQADSVFLNLPGDTLYTVYVQEVTGCTDSVEVFVKDVCQEPLVAEITGLDSVYCEGNASANFIDVASDELVTVTGLSGPGVAGQNLIPAAAGLGEHEILMTVQRQNNCRDTLRDTFEVVSGLTASVSGLNSVYCVNTTDSTLLIGTPPGGTFSGPGVVGGRFFVPALAGEGAHDIIYEGDSASCQFVGLGSTEVFGTGGASISGLDSLYCLKNETVDVLNPSPPGGLLVGPGITGNIFDPNEAGRGYHTIAYYGVFEGCPYISSNLVLIEDSVTVTFEPVADAYCESSTNSVLLEATPDGGTFSGPGILPPNEFVAFAAESGTHQIAYEGTFSGCTYSDTLTMVVQPGPAGEIGNLDSLYCISDPNVYLPDLSPAGGTLSGPGIIGGVFSPTAAGVGVHTLQYVGDSAGCQYSASFTVEVIDVLNDAEIIGLDNIFCDSDAAPRRISGFPAGGRFSGPGIANDSTFIPELAGPGSHVITYRRDAGACPFAITQDIVVFAAPATVSISGTEPGYCAGNTNAVPLTGLPAGGTFSGPGISGADFIPADAGGIGVKQLVYSGTVGACDYADTLEVEIIAKVTPDLQGLEESYCANDGNLYTVAGFPQGGTLLGEGVTAGNRFRPSDVTGGFSVITYAGDSAGCDYVISTSVYISMPVFPTIEGLESVYCVDAPNPATIVTTPPGGTLRGPGIVGNQFLPELAGPGPHTITYEGTVGGCDYFIDTTIAVTDICCPMAEFNYIDNIRTDRADIYWYAAEGATTYEFQYRERGAQNWLTTERRSTFFELRSLDPCTEYEYRVRAFCGVSGYYSDYSDVELFKTLAPECPTPERLRVTQTTDTSATIAWDPITGPCFENYVLEIRREIDTDWTAVSTTDLSLTITDLRPNTDYVARIRSQCDDVTLSDPSDTIMFRTLEFRPQLCDAPTGLQLAVLTDSTALIEWIPAVAASFYDFQWKMDGGDRWLTAEIYTNSFIIEDIVRDTTFYVRIRTRCDQGGFSAFTDTLEFRSLPVCLPPEGLINTRQAKDFARLEWLPAAKAFNYELRVRETGTSAWTDYVVADTFRFVLGLNTGTQYEAQVRTNCGLNLSDYSNPHIFRTLSNCGPPTNVRAAADGPASITARWDAVDNAFGYQVCFKEDAPGANCVTYTRNDPTIEELTNANLQPGTRYEVKVRTRCFNGFTDWVTVFVTTPSIRASVAPNDLSAVSVYPNPAKDAFTVSLETAEAGDATLVLSDATGRAVLTREWALHPGKNELPVRADGLSAGFYLLSIRTKESTRAIKLVIE